jgi:hypothetical protein
MQFFPLRRIQPACERLRKLPRNQVDCIRILADIPETDERLCFHRYRQLLNHSSMDPRSMVD